MDEGQKRTSLIAAVTVVIVLIAMTIIAAYSINSWGVFGIVLFSLMLSGLIAVLSVSIRKPQLQLITMVGLGLAIPFLFIWISTTQHPFWIPGRFGDAASNGCLTCHHGIEVINEKMQPILLAMVNNKEGFECAVCHEGNPASGEKETAHEGMFPNPSSMWVLAKGLGCAKCHSEKGILTTVMGVPLPEPTGGSIQTVVFNGFRSKWRDWC